MNKRFLKTLLLIIGILSVLIPILCSFFTGIDVDSAVILSEMERVCDGYVPYKTIHLNYTPLYFYICVALKWLFHVPYGCYPFYLALHYLFVFGILYWIYKIGREFGGTSVTSLFCAWLFLMVTHWTQGNYVIFEMPSIFFGFASIFSILSFKERNSCHFIWIGALSACSFLVKQFGAGFSLLGLYIIIAFCVYGKWKKAIFYSVGYLMPILLCAILLGRDFIYSVLLNGYGTDTAALVGYDTSVSAKFHQIGDNLFYWCYRICPVVFAAVVLVPRIVKKRKVRELCFCVFGIVGFSLQFWFVQGGLHYTLYMTPFAIIMIPVLLQSCEETIFYSGILYFAITLTVLFALYSTYRNRVYKGIVNKQLAGQIEMSAKLSSKIEKGKSVWIVHGGIEYLYYFNNLIPPNMASIGYATGPLEVTKEKQWKQIRSADYVIRFTRDYPYEYSFDEDVKKYVNEFPADTLDSSGEIVIHKMK